MIKFPHAATILLLAFVSISCNSFTKSNLFSSKTVREKYEDKLKKDSGLNNPVVNAWLNAGELSLNHPLTITSSYAEHGRFTTVNNTATSLKVFVKQGQKLSVELTKTSAVPYTVYIDLWHTKTSAGSGGPAFICAADTLNNKLEYIAEKDDTLLVRYQPQLAVDGSYRINIHTDASFVFPIDGSVKSHIGSFWGVGRDNGARKHEGIDIFAAKRSPVVAVADGVIRSVSENNLGGKVIFLQPENGNYNVYYAHLDTQLVSNGQRVKAGEILGLTGNTGNAKSTASHLHFGIYTNRGAIDPIAFVERKKQPNLNISDIVLNPEMITKKKIKVFADMSAGSAPLATFDKNVVLQPEAFNGRFYRIVLPDGRKAFADGGGLEKVQG